MSENAARILIVDDHEASRKILQRLLAQLGYQVDVAENGRVALTHLETVPCDLVLLDIMMPVLDGFETLLRIRADPQLRHLPVIVISALDDTASIVRCLETGADDCLPKPFNYILMRARISACLERKRLRDREQHYLELMRGQLRLGQSIQADFLPRQLPPAPGWDIAARFHPAHEVAGDFYDVIPLYGGRIGLVVADVCDKGFGAALFMALVRTLMRVFAEIGRPDPAVTSHLPRVTLGALSAVRRTNDYVMAHHVRTNMFASVFFGVLEPEENRLTYVNAGHDPPLHVRGGKILERLTRTGPVVGALPGVQYPWREIRLEPTDLILVYTDGVTEARSAVGDFYTERRLVDLVSGATVDSALSLLDRIERDVADHAAGVDSSDDVTLLAVRRGPE